MDHATSSRLLTATHFATSLLPLTARLVPVITELGRLIVSFRRADPTPRACHRFETRLQESLRELGRIIVEWTFNHLEPHDRKDLPGQIESGGTWYRRRSQDPQSLGGHTLRHDHLVADALPGRPRRRAVDLPAGDPLGAGVRPGHAGPGRARGPGGGDIPPGRGPGDVARRSCGAVVGDDLAGGDRRGGRGDGSPPPRRPSRRLLAWLEQADRSSGDRKPVLAVGRDGLMLPIRGQACYREGATATVSVYDRRGAAVGDGVPREDARAGPGDLVAATDGLDRGGAAGLGRAVAAVGLHHRWGEPPDPLLPPGAPADERSPSSRPATESGTG